MPKIVLIIKLKHKSINKGSDGICESQINDWDCKDRSINFLHLMINLFSIHWFKYVLYFHVESLA